MTDEDLLARLGTLQRKRENDLEALEAVARGTLEPEQLVRNRVKDGEDEAAARALAAALQPDTDVERWHAVAADALEIRTLDPDASTEPKTAAPPRRSNAVWIGAGVLLLVAALALLWFGRTAAPQSALPTYEVVVRNETVRPERGESAGSSVQVYRADSRISWIVRPSTEVEGPISIALVLRGEDGTTRLVAPPLSAIETSAHGVIAVRGRFDEVVQATEGTWSIAFVVGRELPRDLDALDDGGPWQRTAPMTVELRAD